LRAGVPGGGFDSAQGDEQAGNKEILKMVTGSNRSRLASSAFDPL
jgi:hypothetical protein